jgi:hypothetical protein
MSEAKRVVVESLEIAELDPCGERMQINPPNFINQRRIYPFSLSSPPVELP